MTVFLLVAHIYAAHTAYSHRKTAAEYRNTRERLRLIIPRVERKFWKSHPTTPKIGSREITAMPGR
jgi:hypothetical protein